VVSGTYQTLHVDIRPPGTEVTVYRWDGEIVGGPIGSPSSMRVHRPRRNEPYLVVAAKDGACPRYWVPMNVQSAGGALDELAGRATFAISSILTDIMVDDDGASFGLWESEFNGVTLPDEPCGE
jgi:hypothetical protein